METDVPQHTDEEVWRHVEGNDGYIVSNYGRVIGKKGSFLEPIVTKGYLRVTLCEGRVQKGHLIHVLVANAFIENPDPLTLTIVDHINRNRLDNHHSNLRFVTVAENLMNSDRKPSEFRKIVQCFTPEGQFVCEGTVDKLVATMGFEERSLRSALRDGHKHRGYVVSMKEIDRNDRSGMALLQHYCRLTGENPLTVCNPMFTKINGFSMYDITQYGDIWSNKYRYWMTPYLPPQGYWMCCLTSDEKKKVNKYIHRLVCLAYHITWRNVEESVVNHIDGNKTNPYFFNLEWTSSSENTQHAVSMGLQENSIKVCQFTLEGIFVTTHASITHACKAYGVDSREWNRNDIRIGGGFIWADEVECTKGFGGAYFLPDDYTGGERRRRRETKQLVRVPRPKVYMGPKEPNKTFYVY